MLPPPPDETNPLGGPTIPRVVTSRARPKRARRIIAVWTADPDEPQALIPDSGEWLSGGAEITSRLAMRDQSGESESQWLIVADDPGRLYLMLREFGPSAGDDFLVRGSIRETRTLQVTGGMSQCLMTQAILADVRWANRGGGIILTPHGVCDLPIHQTLGIDPESLTRPRTTLLALAIFGRHVTDWCDQAGVHIRPGRGGIAAQLLTSPKFWPEKRRKVPRRLNAIARAHLPGNHYRLFSTDVHPRALELDQRSAHHHAAGRVAFTDADTVHHVGATTDDPDAPIIAAPGDDMWARIISQVGLFFMRVAVDRHAPHRATPLAQIAAEGVTTIAVWSSEFELLMSEPGVEILGIVGAVISETRSRALNTYAEWALDQLAAHAESKTILTWLKPLLLAVYGVMAQTAHPYTTFSAGKDGATEPVVLGGQLVNVHISRPRSAHEPRYVNVLDRGLIEAETRAETIRVARAIEAEADAERAEMVAIYADSVLIAERAPLGGSHASDGDEHAEWAARIEGVASRAGRGRWRSSPLSQLAMLASNAFESTEIIKRPGVPLAARAGPV